jgi:hypothetical protein
MIRFGDEHIDIQMAFPLTSLLRQYVPRVGMPTLDLAGGGQPHALGCAFVGFKFWHEYFPLVSNF